MEILLDGHTAFAYTGGEAFDPSLPCVVFIHGAQLDHSVWRGQSRWFACHGFSVLAVDLPGHGRSSGAPITSIESMAEWIGRLLDSVGVAAAARNVSLVGHSMGSVVALEYAFRYPARVVSVSLIGTAVPMQVSETLLSTAKRDEAAAIAMINDWSHSPRGAMGGSSVPGMWLLGSSFRLMSKQAPGVLHNDLAACNAYQNGLNAAAALSCPSLIISGSKDVMTHPKAAAKLVGALGDAQSVLLEGAGHSLMTEQPDTVLQALRRFIT